MAEAVARCRPEVIPAYPISPQTHIVEALSAMVRDGRLAPCEFLTVESEFAAMSAAIGASACGARTYTATASQGLLYMAEAVFNAAGLGLPVVMTVANRALGAPINIWNDHSDSMSQRDSGWLQLYAESNQHAVDLHLLAYRVAEELSLPVMVCMDGFVLTHAVEGVDLPEQERVDAWLPAYRPRQVLDPDEPVSIGAMVGPEAFTEVKYLAQLRTQQALELLPQRAAELGTVLGHPVDGLVESYPTGEADTIVVALGSARGTLKDTVDELRSEGIPVGMLGLTSFRPFPYTAIRHALAGARRVIVLERAFSMGGGGIVSPEVRAALVDRPTRVYTAVAGLGGRAVTSAALRRLITDARGGRLAGFSFVDLDTGLVEREVARAAGLRRSGPTAENVLADLRSREGP